MPPADINARTLPGASPRRTSQPPQEPLGGLSQDRVNPIRRDLGQGLEHEAAQVETRMGQVEPRLPYDHSLEIEQVQVKGPGGVRRSALPAECALGFQQRRQHRLRRPARGVHKGRGVGERRVGGVGPCLSDAGAGNGENPEAVGLEPRQPGIHERCAGAPPERQIRADRYEGATGMTLRFRDRFAQ